MPETYRIRITPRALADLESIFRTDIAAGKIRNGLPSTGSPTTIPPT